MIFHWMIDLIKGYKINFQRQNFLSSFLFKLLILSFTCNLFTNCHAQSWRDVSPGIQYQDLGASLFNPWSHIHVFKINLKNNKLDLVLASQLSKHHASVEEFAQYSHALITLNGGFFDRQFNPLGLRVSQHHQVNPVKRISWWGIFYIQNNKPFITTHKGYHKSSTINFALQSGPRLIINGKIPTLKPGIAERSALGITPNNEVIVLVTDNCPMSTTQLAELMKSQPLSCDNALNLDGGSSTQLKANTKTFELSVHGFSRVSDAIIVLPKT
tara:strand:+ start:304 stop:1116 length:813 start_codon:yes stop_codon:yes gene_type:complete